MFIFSLLYLGCFFCFLVILFGLELLNLLWVWSDVAILAHFHHDCIWHRVFFLAEEFFFQFEFDFGIFVNEFRHFYSISLTCILVNLCGLMKSWINQHKWHIIHLNSQIKGVLLVNIDWIESHRPISYSLESLFAINEFISIFCLLIIGYAWGEDEHCCICSFGMHFVSIIFGRYQFSDVLLEFLDKRSVFHFLNGAFCAFDGAFQYAHGMGCELFYSKCLTFGNWESAPFRMLKGASRYLFIINTKLTSVVAPCGHICIRYHPCFENVFGNLWQDLSHKLIALVENFLSI